MVLFRAYKQLTYTLALLAMLWACGKNGKISSFEPNPISVEKQNVVELEQRESCPDFALFGTDGTRYDRDDFSDHEVLIVLFLSNHCPESQDIENKLIQFKESMPAGVAMVGISGNSPLATPLSSLGYSDLDDSYDSMKERADRKGFNFPYLYDGDDQSVTLKFGPSILPMAYVFDRDRRLYGRTNFANSDIGKLSNLVNNLISEAPIQQRRNLEESGCPLHWSWDKQKVKAEWEEWKEREVLLTDAYIGDLDKILEGDPHNLKVVNFWATWCGPCKKEFPEFLKISRQFKERPVDFLTVSVDKSEKKKEASEFLKQVHAPLRNYILTDISEDSVRAAIGGEWDGTIPLTIIIDPAGRILKRWSGPFDKLELKRSIVNHPVLKY